MSPVISIVNQKGGVGKTTTTYNLAAALCRYNKRVLAVDLDPQGNLTRVLGIDPELARKTILDVLLGDLEWKKAIRKTNVHHVHLLPGNLSLAMLESQLSQRQMESSHHLLSKAIDEKARKIYDFILIDCPPSLSLLSLNALSASDELIVPIQCEYFALEALPKLLSTIYRVQREDNPRLEVLGMVLTMFDSRVKLSTDIAQKVRQDFKDKVFPFVIPRSQAIAEAAWKNLPVNQYKPASQGSQAYSSLAREVLSYYERKREGESLPSLS